jgi:hypothetical protein
MVILTHAFSGSGFPAYPAEFGPGYQREPETERITGAFRVVEDDGSFFVIGNGEDPEKFWMVDWDEWDERAEDHTPASPAFVEAISNPIIRAGLRRQVADMRATARRCGDEETDE